LDEPQSWSLDALRSILESFEQDWARRRLLSAMLERGLPEDTAEAVGLVASLESRASRRWCVSVMLHERELSESERRELREIL
jgi:hypothetical protein